ncbi:MAG TPA: hypothetical protein PLS03_18485 [Terrimicrobiaceae bacterium]|nr:hypothetical protein [Terrimicrobiaceae bacterium]
MSSRNLRRLDASRLSEPRLQVQSLAPRFGENYKTGYIGFTHSGSRAVSRGIAHLTRWSRMSDLHVSHVLVVTGENECVEALPDKGVVKSELAPYFDDAKTQVFFRKPRRCTGALGGRIAATALAQVGTKYDHLLLAAQLLEGSFLRRWIMSAFRESPDRFVGRLLNREARWICSELAAYCLDCQPEYADKGVLGQPHYAVSPQELFEDTELFASWKNEAASVEDEPVGE